MLSKTAHLPRDGISPAGMFPEGHPGNENDGGTVSSEFRATAVNEHSKRDWEVPPTLAAHPAVAEERPWKRWVYARDWGA